MVTFEPILRNSETIFLLVLSSEFQQFLKNFPNFPQKNVKYYPENLLYTSITWNFHIFVVIFSQTYSILVKKFSFFKYFHKTFPKFSSYFSSSFHKIFQKLYGNLHNIFSIFLDNCTQIFLNFLTFSRFSKKT